MKHKLYHMKLSHINEVSISRAAGRMQPLLRTMPRSKRKHSKRVAHSLKKAGANETAIYAGLLHDYLERGGDVYSLHDHIDELGLPIKIISLVNVLSDDEKQSEDNSNQPLAHMQSILRDIADEDLKNMIILIKLSDRLDNLNKRVKKGKLGKKYIIKSIELVDWLKGQYTGKNKPLKKLIAAINELVPSIIFQPL